MLFLQTVSHLAICYALLATAISAQNINWVDCSKHVPPPATFFDATGVNLKALPPTLHCGRLEVPMDYAKPISSTNKITLGLAMYRPKNPKGVIFFCPDGTDAGVAAAWRVALNQTSDYYPNFSGLADYDLMMMDIRGTCSSDKLKVSLDAVAALIGPYPTDQSEYHAYKSASKAMVHSFDKWSSPPGIFKFTGMSEVVQDYESIRKALGYNKINFLGLSYGSYRAQHHAAKYPKHAGSFVLDAVTAPGMSLYDLANTDILASNRALLRSDAYCQNDSTCPLKSEGKGSVPKTYAALLAAVSNFSTSTFHLQYALYSALQNQPVFPLINTALSSNAFTSGSSGLKIDAGVGLPYLCSDYYFNNIYASFVKSRTAASTLDTHHIGINAAWSTRIYCSAWPYAVAPLKTLSFSKPMLFVTADFDASTPTEWAMFAWEHAAKSKSALVVRHGDDHTTFNLPGSAATGIDWAFLRTGVLPKVAKGDKVDVYHAGMERRPVPGPYTVRTGLVAGDCPVAEECNLNRRELNRSERRVEEALDVKR